MNGGGMNVSMVIPTRGDVDMAPITESFPPGWEVLVYDNGAGVCRTYSGSKWGVVASDLPDLGVYARYAAIQYASHDLILTQDDDVIVSDPQAIVDALGRKSGYPSSVNNSVVCNMPPEFRPHYPDSGLVGFGAAFHRDAPGRAFERWGERDWRCRGCNGMRSALCADCEAAARDYEHDEAFLRRADNVFTTLTPRVLVDVPKTDCAYASDPNRMWRQSGHIGERDRMIALARQVRDA